MKIGKVIKIIECPRIIKPKTDDPIPEKVITPQKDTPIYVPNWPVRKESPVEK